MQIKLTKTQLGIIILLCLFILGGTWVLGYQKGIKNASSFKAVVPTQVPASAVSSQNACTTDNDCALFDTSAINTMSLCCGLNRCSDYTKESVQAVNKQWLIAQKINTCGNKRIMCPMIAVMCTKQITEIQRSYEAKCVKNVCSKLKAG